MLHGHQLHAEQQAADALITVKIAVPAKRARRHKNSGKSNLNCHEHVAVFTRIVSPTIIKKINHVTHSVRAHATIIF